MSSYIVYKCKICNKHFILLSDEVKHSERESRYITCSYDGRHKNIAVVNRFDSLKECMDNHVFVREGRRIKQVK